MRITRLLVGLLLLSTAAAAKPIAKPPTPHGCTLWRSWDLADKDEFVESIGFEIATEHRDALTDGEYYCLRAADPTRTAIDTHTCDGKKKKSEKALRGAIASDLVERCRVVRKIKQHY